ncbi:uncharacterized protein LOC125651149 [Ostrea edulis]|uniref:uncharacterized protein LOC125651149 n=1 Tax=Ostrea edulis TaxID=37623 RepID=UPI0024AFD4DB|nr:uncharacterized protein LOC125651149 [Ostrea edulis]XP_056013959.1 uncharacterized protein LOC125651149 [Ostrea edulis]XP_056013960.1 uncharacterized protein LOC125651149 [Ostrea edulis]
MNRKKKMKCIFQETKTNSIFRYVVLQILVLLSVETLRANSDSCLISRATVQRAIDCPVTEEGWSKAAERKNCSAYADQCSQPEKLEYHCVINPFVNETIEVCAYRRFIFLGHCTEYSYSANRIQQSRSTDCTKFTDRPCPQGYPSTEAYKYPGCYDLTKASSTENPITLQSSDPTLSTQDVENITTFEGSANDDGINTIAIVVLFVLIIMVICMITFVVLKRKRNTSTGKGHHQMLKMNEGNGVQDSYHHDTILAEEETLDGKKIQ